jgi:ElaB/YqjD/DUF883 family membrane-anchored ribosome-binding protein
MLAALLLNLDVEAPPQQLGGGGHSRDQRKRLKALAENFTELLSQEVPDSVKPLQRLKKRVKRVVEAQPDELSELIRDLSMRSFELRQASVQSSQQEPIKLLILEQVTILLILMQEQEEEAFLLLLE